MIEPKDVHLAVVGEKLADLVLVELVVFPVVSEQVIRVIPIALGIIDAETQPRRMAGVGEFLDDIPLKRGVGDGVIRELGVEHREPVVMFADEHEVFHAGVLGDLHPLRRVELHGVELLVKIVVFRVGAPAGVAVDIIGARSLAAPTDFHSLQRDGPPVDEQSELRVAPPLHPGVALCGSLGERWQLGHGFWKLGVCGGRCQRGTQGDKEKGFHGRYGLDASPKTSTCLRKRGAAFAGWSWSFKYLAGTPGTCAPAVN